MSSNFRLSPLVASSKALLKAGSMTAFMAAISSAVWIWTFMPFSRNWSGAFDAASSVASRAALADAALASAIACFWSAVSPSYHCGLTYPWKKTLNSGETVTWSYTS